MKRRLLATTWLVFVATASLTQQKDYLYYVLQPEQFVVNSLATALQFSLDAYEILKDEALLVAAKKYATIGSTQLWSGKMFVRQPGDPYYEAKLGTNALVAGFLRLHLLENHQPAEATLFKLSF